MIFSLPLTSVFGYNERGAFYHLRKMVENGGKLEVESQPGKGATFALYFPVIEEKSNNDEVQVW